jgi:eukaryotic-like serine/threonine-protein kinase
MVDDAVPTVETERPTHASHRLVKRIGSAEGFEFYLGDRSIQDEMRRAVIKTATKRVPGYVLRRKRMLEEARIEIAFRHPNFAALLDAAEDGHGTHLVYEYVQGTNLERACTLLRERNEALPFELCAWILNEVLRGASFAHLLSDEDGSAQCVVLNDLTPANVLVSSAGEIKLATFAMRLSPHADPRSDVHAAGMLLFELLFGRQWERGGSIPIDLLLDDGVPQPLVDVVARATASNPKDRFPNAASMGRELTRWLETAAHHASAGTVAKFFMRQSLFDDTEVKVVPLRDVMDDEPTKPLADPMGTNSAEIVLEEMIAESVDERSVQVPVSIQVAVSLPPSLTDDLLDDSTFATRWLPIAIAGLMFAMAVVILLR